MKDLIVKYLKKEVYGVIDFLFSFLINYDEKKMHNILDVRSYIQKFEFFLIGCEQGVIITINMIEDPCSIHSWSFAIILHPLLKVENDLLTKMMRIAIWVQHGWSVKKDNFRKYLVEFFNYTCFWNFMTHSYWIFFCSINLYNIKVLFNANHF